MQTESMDTRKYEQTVHDAGATDYERVIVAEYGMKHKYFTTYIWGISFSELFLDYGCGTGTASRVLTNIGREVVAFDVSSKMCAITKKTCKVPVVVADAFNLPFKDKVFSTICITGVLHHILDLNSAFKEIKRVAKDVICINEPSMPQSPFVMKLFNIYHYSTLRRIFSSSCSTTKYKGSRYERALDANELIRLCKKFGFHIIRIRFFTHIPVLHLFLSEKIRKYIFAGLISAKKGTHIEIIARLEGAQE